MIAKERLDDEKIREIRLYVRRHKNVTEVYKALAKKYGYSWQRIREVADDHYGRKRLIDSRKFYIKKNLERMAKILNPIERYVMKKSLHDVDFASIGRDKNITRERVRQIFADALNKLRVSDWRCSMRDYRRQMKRVEVSNGSNC